MQPCRRIHHRYYGVCGHLDGTFTMVIWSANERVSLGTFANASGVARAYNAATWRLGLPRARMNFRNCHNAEEAADMAEAPRLVTDEDHRRHRCRAVIGLV